MQFIDWIKNLFTTTNWEEDYLKDYLSRSTDHADLERRIRQLDRREVKAGPFGVSHTYKY